MGKVKDPSALTVVASPALLSRTTGAVRPEIDSADRVGESRRDVVAPAPVVGDAGAEGHDPRCTARQAGVGRADPGDAILQEREIRARDGQLELRAGREGTARDRRSELGPPSVIRLNSIKAGSPLFQK